MCRCVSGIFGLRWKLAPLVLLLSASLLGGPAWGRARAGREGADEQDGLASDRIDEMSIRVQRCMATFEGVPIYLKIEYRGNLVSGHRLTIYGIEAEVPPEEGSEGGSILGDLDFFAPQDRYAPRGFMEKLRSRFRLPFMKRLSGKYGSKLLKVDTLLSKEDYSFKITETECPGLVQVYGYDDYVYLPAVFAHETEAGTIAGAVRKDTDGDRILNIFDPHPFYFDETPADDDDEDLQDRAEDRVEDEARDRVEDEAQDQVKDEAREQVKDEARDEARNRTRDQVKDRARRRTDSETRRRLQEKRDSFRQGDRARRGRMFDEGRYRKIKVDVPRTEKFGHVTGHVARRGFSWGRFFAKPWIAIPALTAVYFSLDKTVFNDDDEVRRTGVLTNN